MPSMEQFCALLTACDNALSYPRNVVSGRVNPHVYENFYRKLEERKELLFQPEKREDKIVLEFWEFGDQDQGS